MEFDRKLDNFKRKFHKIPPRSIIKNEEQLAGMRESSKINIAVLDYVAENIHAGMTTQDIDDLVYQKTTEMGGIPAPLNNTQRIFLRFIKNVLHRQCFT